MITGIEILKFGVEDRTLAQKFLTDFGLKATASDLDGADLFQTQNGSKLYLFDIDDERLPAAIEAGSTLREVVWGVESVEDLTDLAKNLQAEQGFQHTDSMVQCLDPNGMTITFQSSIVHTLPELKAEGINQYGRIERINAASPVYEQGEPISIGHVVFFTPDLAKTENFYKEKLGFFLSDAYKDRGAFLRCRGTGYHHDLFLLSVPNKPAGLNHVAFVVRDIHEVIGGGLNMNRAKWSTFIGPGRHPISSAYFWYVHSPLGGAFEYYTNDDYLTEEWQPRIEEHRLELFTEWAIEGGLDHDTRRQIKAG
ncbi:VOC family protein [Acinetobacter puyangensis]|uniref:Glyoxalase/Bleomycin resistance protein/Dioxygenase superfamily protein n=1 Tax=Acinetobacter puyangensis TaxID=1096779 RepID=A0A240EEL7_9GAMM|nr:VOC family protein [Acinetobacter puyangensis]SNX46405.1 Glyoxalase/Bleomycin resistance protein/Dioxygenase superfamily protein [Acinetobacter puyangensis]